MNEVVAVEFRRAETFLGGECDIDLEAEFEAPGEPGKAGVPERCTGGEAVLNERDGRCVRRVRAGLRRVDHSERHHNRDHVAFDPDIGVRAVTRGRAPAVSAGTAWTMEVATMTTTSARETILI